MELQYITNTKGHKSAVQLPINDWLLIQKELKELEKLRDKKAFFADLIESVQEVKLAKQGKIKLQSAKDFLNEL
ncbi:MAG: hypothetical protein Q8S54_12080 [Bacteroidota bacterium]|nr:hypothetical protein [Bacteroidota bacterium]